MTFDGMHADYYTSGQFYIVKSATVKIQGLYAPTHATNGLAVTKQIAVGGPFLKNNILIIGEEHAYYNGAAILTGFPSNFNSPDGMVKIVYNNQGKLLQPGREGKSLHVLHISLPLGVTIQVNRWNEEGEGRYINSQITMSAQPGQDGQCGNFNGIPADDTRMAVRARIGKDGVPASELMFPGAKTPVDQGIEDCDDVKLTAAHATCKAVTKDSFWPKMSCLKSVCHGGPATV